MQRGKLPITRQPCRSSPRIPARDGGVKFVNFVGEPRIWLDGSPFAARAMRARVGSLRLLRFAHRRRATGQPRINAISTIARLGTSA
jgi:hypothetical protein